MTENANALHDLVDTLVTVPMVDGTLCRGRLRGYLQAADGAPIFLVVSTGGKDLVVNWLNVKFVRPGDAL